MGQERTITGRFTGALRTGRKTTTIFVCLLLCLLSPGSVLGAETEEPAERTLVPSVEDPAAVETSVEETSNEEPNPWKLTASLDTHASILSDLVDRSLLNFTLGYGARFGFRYENFGAFFIIEQNLWKSSESADGVPEGALNIGLGGEYIYGDGHLRTSVAVGASVLLFDTFLDKAGETGLFIYIQPAGIRWELSPSWNVVFDPLSAALVAPVLGGIPLVNLEYRSVFNGEFTW